MSSPTARSLQECRKRGYTAQVVERWCQYSRRRIDLFGVVDIVAITPTAILAIQACAGASHANRMTKIQAEPRTALWLQAGGKLSIWSWSKRGAKGHRKTWTLREEEIHVLPR